jgi:hypothetical protein
VDDRRSHGQMTKGIVGQEARCCSEERGVLVLDALKGHVK